MRIMSGDPLSDKSTEHVLADLRYRFQDSLELRLIEIDQATQVCQKTNADAAFQLLRDHCHRLAGVGASFGFAELGDRARSIDMAVSQYLVTPGSDGWKRQVLADAESLMAAMEAALPEQHYQPPKRENDTYYG